MTLNIQNFIIDGFQKVCDIDIHPNNHENWYYRNINHSIMFANHKSWVYFIVEDNEIIKVGETGNPLGIRKESDWYSSNPQPLSGSKCRTGRYINGDGTDRVIRDGLYESISNKRHNYSFWAKKCDYITTQFTICGQPYTTFATVHKDLEKQYLDFININFGTYPRLNKGRA
jgi:hypothetical protein